MIRSLAASFLALLVISGLCASARAVPISGMFSGDSTLTPTSTPGVFTHAYTGDGVDTTFGSFTVQANSIIDFSRPPDFVISDGIFTETFAEGMLFGTSSGEGIASGTGTGTGTVDIVFTGGTGVFANATGEATVSEMIVRTGPTTGLASGTYTGTLSIVPEPSSLALLATAILAFLSATTRRDSRSRTRRARR